MATFSEFEEAAFVPDYEELPSVGGEEEGGRQGGIEVSVGESSVSELCGMAVLVGELESEVCGGTPSEISVMATVACVPVTGPKPSKSHRLCPVCMGWTTHMRRHVHDMHLPWYHSFTSCCWECQARVDRPEKHDHPLKVTDNNLLQWCYWMNGLLHFLKFHLDCLSLNDLLTCAVARCLYSKSSQDSFSLVESSLLSMLQSLFGLPEVPVYTVSPPNSVLSLLHWRSIVALLTALPPSIRQEFKSLAYPVTLDGFPVQGGLPEYSPVPVVDSHFHLDRLLQKARCSSF